MVRCTIPKSSGTNMTKLTYPRYSNLCGWNAMLPPRQQRAALNQDIAVDYAIVGAGFTGFAIARRLRELDPDASIAVIEATTVGKVLPPETQVSQGPTCCRAMPR